MNQLVKYQRCLVMAGGGFHFGYYLGVYTALEELGQKPDIILASCGGSIAAALIQSLPDDAARKAWLCSPQMYGYWCELKSKQGARLSRIFLNAMKRRFSTGNARIIPDLFNDYMFEIPAQLPLPERDNTAPTVDVAIVAGKLLYTEEDVGQLRNSRKLFSEVIFCNERAAALLNQFHSPLSSSQFGDNAVSQELLTDITMPLAAAVRASIADMFYFRCYSHNHSNSTDHSPTHYIGGVIDLFPIEVANQLAENVTMELKGGYDKTYGIPALRTVLGFNGNERLRYVLNQQADRWFDTSDMESYFLRQRIYQKIIWHKNVINVVTPPTYDAYVQMIEAQWQYGYQRGLQNKFPSGKQGIP